MEQKDHEATSYIRKRPTVTFQTRVSALVAEILCLPRIEHEERLSSIHNTNESIIERSTCEEETCSIHIDQVGSIVIIIIR